MSLSSCFKQESPVVKPDVPRSAEDQLRLIACGEVNFIKNLVAYDNVKSLFRCLGWNKHYKHIYNSIEATKSENWNHLFSVFGKEFFDNTKRRDRIFKYVRKLDSKEGLDDLSRVLTALNKTNFYDSLDELLTCADSPSLPICKRRTSNSATKGEIKELLSFMMVDSDLYGHMSNVLRNIAQSIGDERSKFLIEVDKFNRKVAFKDLRRSLLTSLISSANRGISAKDRVFLAKMFFTVSRDDKKPWLYKWFVNESLDEESFNALVNYPTYVNSDFVKDSLALQNAIKENLVCKSQDGEEYIEINVRQHLETFLDKLSRSSFDEFQKYALQNTATLTTARAFCPILEEYTSEINFWKGGRQVTELYTLNFVDVIASLGDFLGVETNYDLIRIITTASRGESSSDILYALELLGSESFQIFNELNKVILKESKGFYPLVLKSIKNINEDIFSQFGAIVLTLVDEENESKFKALSSVWNFWTEEEKDFLLLFLDEHLKGETNFVALFDFYADLMNEFPGVVEVIAKDLVGSEINLNKTFVALKDVVKQFRGKEVLDNFKEFYSRDQIVRIIEVISRGVQIDGPDIGAFDIDYVDNYVQAARETPFDFLWADSDIPTGSIVECIKEMSRHEQNFYTLIRQLPRACKESKNHEFTIRLFTWMDKIDKEYHSTNTRGDYQKGLFDELGFFSPAMMGTGISLLKFIQEEFGDTKDGFEYTVNKFKKYLFDLRLELTNQRGFVDSLELIVDQWNRLNKISGSNGRLHRSFIFKELALKEEWPRKKTLVSKMTKLLNDYQSWVDSGQASKASFIKSESQPEQYKCKNYQNTKIGNNPCQEKEGLYKGVDDLLRHLSRSNSDKRPTGVGQLVRSSIAEQGLLIPFDRDNQTLKRMTLKETMEMMYRLTDKSIEVNTKKYPYYPIGVRPNKVDEKDYLQPMTTMERIEVTIRDVRFDMNYLGAHYQNAVARSVDYNKVVEGKGKLFKTCLSVRFCGKFFSRDQYRMAVNAIETYYGLLDANAHFGYGDYMKGLLTMVVGSSSKIAAKDATLRWKVGGKEVVIPYIQTKGQLKKHNGVILTDLAMMSAFSNGGRVIRDRVGRTQKEFDQFLASKGFNLVNEKILEGFEREGAEASAIELINNLLKVKTPEGRLVHHDIIDFFSDLDYSELKFVEKTISDMLVVFSYVGVPPWIPKDKRESSEYKRYLNSNYYSFFQYLSKYVELYPALKSKLPRRLDGSKVKVLDVLKVLASPLKFFRMKLEAEDPDYYFVLNELFLGLNKFLFTTKSSLESKGVALLLNFLRDPAEIGDLYLNLRNLYALLDVMHVGEQKGSFSEIAFHIQKLNKTEKLNFNALREYINHTSREENCTQSDNTIRSCVNNPHYDEFAKLGEYVLRRDISSESNLYKGLKTLLIDEKENLYKLINDFTPYLILR